MNVFVSYSTKDLDKVKPHLDYLKEQKFKLNIQIFENNTDKKWKKHALKKIKNSQMLLFFNGKESSGSKNIQWELKKALKYDIPIYTVMLEADNKKPECLEEKDDYYQTNKQKIIYRDEEIEIEQLARIIQNHEEENYNVVNKGEITKNEILLEQYKIFLQTSEDLVERRQNVNNFYITINSAFIALFGALMTFEIDKLYQSAIGIVFSVMGIILSFSWIKLLDSYGTLNKSKMTVIGCIEKELAANLYAAEWEVMSDKLNRKKYVSFTESEKRIPKIFIALYILLLIGLVCYFFFGKQ